LFFEAISSCKLTKKRAGGRGMTPIQEISNAVTMVLPTWVIAWNACLNSSSMVVLLLVGSCIHLPFSLLYHTCAALKCYPDRIDNDLRRLDQSMQHVVGTMFSFALSGSFKYAALNLIFNAMCIRRLWDADTSNDGKRWISVMQCILMYTLPIIWRGDVYNYVLAISSIGVGGLCFIPCMNCRVFNGWGHTVFHLLLSVYAQALANSALLMVRSK
jgi:hypothetical protein